MARLELRLLGPFQVAYDGKPITAFESVKVRALLAYLAAEAPRPQPRERLAGLLWPDWPQRSAMSNLRYALADLRKNLHDREARPPFLLISRESIQLNAESDCWLDLGEFQQSAISPTELRRIQHSAASSQPPTINNQKSAIENRQSIIELYRGEFLEGFSLNDSPAFEEWILAKRQTYQRQALQLLHDLAEEARQHGDHAQALDYARRQVELEPWREEAHRQIMHLLAASGQRSAALAQYETCRRLLKNELGVEPAEETTQLYEQIRGGELSSPASPPPFLLGREAQDPELSPFVARRAELARLRAALNLALGGKGQVFFITGSPGRGKSSLAQEFIRQSLQAHPDLVAASGNCQAYFGRGDPYLPFREILEMLTGEVEERWASGRISQNHAWRLWRLIPHSAEAIAEDGPALVDVLIPGSSLLKRASQVTQENPGWLGRLREIVRLHQHAQTGEGTQQEGLFSQYNHVIRSIANYAPILIFLDDLQWADPGSLSLLFTLGRQIGGSRILIVGAYRSEEVLPETDESPHPLAAIQREFQLLYGDLRIDLDEAEGRLFVDALVDREPNRLGQPFRELLFRQTRGHALFTVELLHDMQARGDLVKNEAGEWEESPGLRWDILPARVEAAIAQRIQRLPRMLRELLQTASMEGESFTAEVVAELHGTGVPVLLKLLGEELDRQHQLVQAEGLARIAGQRLSRYRFRHILFQRYLYTNLDPLRRASLHEQVGEALERLYGSQAGEVAGQLARHFEEAGLFEKAIAYLEQAGERAAKLAANQEGVSYFTRALGLIPEIDPAARFRLLLHRWKVYNRTGQRQAEEEDILALERLAEPLGTAFQAQAAMCRAHYAQKFFDLSVLSKTVPAAIAWAQASGQTVIEAEACMFLNMVVTDRAAIKANFERGLLLARQAGLKGLEADILRDMGVNYYKDDFFAGIDCVEHALQLYRSLGDRYGEGRALNTLGDNYVSLGDYSTALAHVEQAKAICREVGNRFDEVFSIDSIASISLCLGRPEGLYDVLVEALGTARELKFPNLIIMILSLLSLVSRQQGEPARALAYAEQERQYFSPHLWDPLGEGFTLFDVGSALQALNRLNDANSAFQRGVEILEASERPGDRDYLLLNLTGLASLALEQGHLAQALGYAGKIWPLHFTKRLNFHEYYLGWSYLTCCQVFQANGDPRAAEALAEAHAVLQARATRISDGDLCRSFLENVPWHREIVTLWEAHEKAVQE